MKRATPDKSVLRIEKLERKIEDRLTQQEALAEWEARTERIIDEKLQEIKSVAYLLLLISAVLLALLLGMVINAVGFRI